MPRAKVTSKGQITIPAEVRKAMGIEAGSTVNFWPNEDGSFRLQRTISIMELEGCLAGFVVPKSDEEMNALIAQHAWELDEATKSSAEQTAESEAA